MNSDMPEVTASHQEDETEPPVTTPPTPEEYNTFAHQDDDEVDEMESTSEQYAGAGNE